MIKKLRKRFIILATISLFFLLFIIMLSSSLLSYHSLIKDADEILQTLVDNAGRFPKGDRLKKTKPEDEKLQKPNFQKDKKKMSPEISYESRFFTAFVLEDSDKVVLNMDQIAAIDEEEARHILEEVQKCSDENGFYGDYRYWKSGTDRGFLFVFLDCGRKLDTFWKMVWINIMISVLAFVAVVGILMVLSGKIVRPVAEAYEKQKQFISVAGHEMKTPLTIIDADSELLRMDTGEDNEWLEDICTQTKRLANLTNELLQLTRMDELRNDVVKIEFPLSDLINETVKSFQVLADKEKICFEVSVEPLLSYCGDEKQIRQLAGILLDNAIKYVSGKGPIQITLKKRKQGIVFTVENPVEYISKEQCLCFFDRFYRTEQSQRSEKGGYGLGLAIAKSIVETHGGKISAEALDEKQVRMKVTL